MTRHSGIWFCLAICGLLLAAEAGYAQVPHLIRYQGQAVDTGGVPLEGPYTLTFRLYDAATGGQVLWQEIQPVSLTGGHFSVLLGQVTPLDAMGWEASCWLGVQVNEEPELSPRQQITSVPLAILAQAAEALTEPITPALITPQGAGSGLDADTVDGQQASALLSRSAHTGAQAPNTISPQGAGSGLDADKLDGKDASAFAANPHSHSCVKRMVMPGGQTGNSFCGQQGEWCAMTITGNGQSVDGCGTTNPGFGDWGASCCR